MNTFRILEEFKASLGESAAKSLAQTPGTMFEELKDTVVGRTRPRQRGTPTAFSPPASDSPPPATDTLRPARAARPHRVLPAGSCVVLPAAG